MQGQRTTLWSLFFTASLKWVLGQQACKPSKNTFVRLRMSPTSNTKESCQRLG